MTPLELSTFIYNWVNQIINTEPTRTITIIFARQDAPAPPTPYLSISRPFAITKEHSASVGEVKDDGTREMVIDYACTVSFYEVGDHDDSGVPDGGDGRFLMELVNSIEREDIKELFQTNGVSYRFEEVFQGADEERESIWELVDIVDIRFGFAVKITEETGWIETIEYDADIS